LRWERVVGARVRPSLPQIELKAQSVCDLINAPLITNRIAGNDTDAACEPRRAMPRRCPPVDPFGPGTSFGKVCLALVSYLGFGVMRRSSWTPSIVPNDREANVLVDNSGRGIAYRDPAVAKAGQFKNAIPVAHFQALERRSEEDVSVIQRRSDLALSVGTAFALALPAILGAAVYLVTHALLQAS
jgi:hypothetical protein